VLNALPAQAGNVARLLRQTTRTAAVTDVACAARLRLSAAQPRILSERELRDRES
jgi:hypothetical protein